MKEYNIIEEALLDINYKIQETKKRHSQELKEFEEKRLEIKNALDLVNELMKPYQCTHCNGSGKKKAYDVAGQLETVMCDFCNGTGIKCD